MVDAGPVALFGANGAGKTNILEAISLLSPGRGLRRANLDEMTRTPESLGWKITAGLDSLGHQHEIESRFQPNTSRQVRIDDKSAAQNALGRLARIIWLVPAMDRLWLEGAEGRRRFLDRMALSLFPDHADLSLVYEKSMRDRNRLLKDGVGDAAWYRALEAQMARAGAGIIENRDATLDRIAMAQDGASTAFPAATLSLVSHNDMPAPKSQEALIAALAANRTQDMAAGRTLIGPHRVDLGAVYRAKGVAAKLCSTGEQKALLISLILANARALADEFAAPPIILLDEIAAHLDKDRRAALYDEICALGAQAWMTGTEAALFDALGSRAQMFEVRDTENGSEIEEK